MQGMTRQSPSIKGNLRKRERERERERKSPSIKGNLRKKCRKSAPVGSRLRNTALSFCASIDQLLVSVNQFCTEINEFMHKFDI